MVVLDKEQAEEALSKSELAFIGILNQCGQCQTTCSNPPTHHFNGMEFKDIRPLRGSTFSEKFLYEQKGKDTSTYRSHINSDGSRSKPELVVKPEPKYPQEEQLYLVILSDSDHIQDLVEIDQSTMTNLVQSA